MPSYIEQVAELLEGKMVEVYIGDQYEEVSFSDNAKSVCSVLCGKLVSGTGELLILDSFFKDRHAKIMKHGNMIYINTYSVVAIVEINGNGTLRDAIHSADDSPGYQPGGKHPTNVKNAKRK